MKRQKRLFGEKHLNDYFTEQLNGVKWETNNISEKGFESKTIDELTEQIFNSCKIEHVTFSFENRNVSTTMNNLNWNEFPKNYDVRPGQKYKCASVIYSYEKPKQSDLYAYLPRGFSMQSPITFITEEDKISFKYQTYSASEELPDQIKIKVKDWIKKIQDIVTDGIYAINTEIDFYNQEIKKVIPILLEERKNKLQKLSSQKNDLNDF